MGRLARDAHVALIVEDETEVRQFAATLLEETDMDVFEASSAEEALHYLERHGREVALLFADVRLPCLMNGLDLARKVKHRWPWVRTILTSGAPLDRDDGDMPRDVRFMLKPWRPLEVLMEAERALAKAS